LLVRDEADVVDAHISFHLNAGVDIVIVTDHRSDDGTTEILRSLERGGRVRLLVEPAQRIRQSDWVTRMARLAASEHGADWVINSDADEFWWPATGSLKDVLAAVPDEYAVVRALQRPFVPRPDDGRHFAERMTYRLTVAAPINDPSTPYRPVVKAAHRADPNVLVGQGNHSVSGLASARLDAWSPIELFHLPLRSREQCARKHRNTWTAWQENLRGDLAFARTATELGRPEAFYDRAAVGDEALRRGLDDGTLVEDTRLRDALRALRGFSPAGESAGERQPLRFTPPLSRDRAAFASEASCFAEAELVRLQRRADVLAARVAAREQQRLVARGRSGRVRFDPDTLARR
jgi:glycosyl transferase family 2